MHTHAHAHADDDECIDEWVWVWTCGSHACNPRTRTHVTHALHTHTGDMSFCQVTCHLASYFWCLCIHAYAYRRMPQIGAAYPLAPYAPCSHLAPYASGHACERLTVGWWAAASAGRQQDQTVPYVFFSQPANQDHTRLFPFTGHLVPGLSFSLSRALSLSFCLGPLALRGKIVPLCKLLLEPLSLSLSLCLSFSVCRCVGVCMSGRAPGSVKAVDRQQDEEAARYRGSKMQRQQDEEAARRL